MDTPSPPVDLAAQRREAELDRQEKKKKEDVENERIRSLRGRGGAYSLFSAAEQNPAMGNQSTLGWVNVTIN